MAILQSNPLMQALFSGDQTHFKPPTMATRFKALKHNEYMLFKIGVFRNQFPKKSIVNNFFKSLLIYYFVLVSTTFIISGAMYACQSVVGFSATLRASFFAIGTVQAVGIFISFGINTSKVQAVHLKLQKIVDESSKGE